MATSLRVLTQKTPKSWSDEDIKALSRSEPKEAMGLIIGKYRDRLFYHALCIVKDGQEAYDVTQEVFIRAIRERRFFTEEFKMKAWLFRVTSNLCFNLVRDRKRRAAILEGQHQTEASLADQVDKVFQGERKQEVLAGIDKMTEDHKRILLLRYYEDLSYAEIADVLEVKLGTVMSRLSRARGRLLDVMNDRSLID